MKNPNLVYRNSNQLISSMDNAEDEERSVIKDKFNQ